MPIAVKKQFRYKQQHEVSSCTYVLSKKGLICNPMQYLS